MLKGNKPLEVEREIQTELEKNSDFFKLFMTSVKYVPPSRFTKHLAIFFSLLTILFGLLTDKKASEIANLVRSLSEIGLNFSLSILGFLIAGFTIFATITDKKLFIDLASVPIENSNLSYLKHIFYSFIVIFGNFLLLMSFCLIIKIFFVQGGLFSILFHLVFISDEIKEKIVSVIDLVIIINFFAISIGLLQSFLYNIYSTTLFSIGWEYKKNHKT